MNLYEETKQILKQNGIHASKSLGQNFLIEETVIDKIIESAKIEKQDHIIEIGPGIGSLSKKILEKAGRLTAVELDSKMIPILQKRFNSYSNFELIHDDILKVDLKSQIENTKRNFQDLTRNKNSSKFTILYYNTNNYETA